MRATSAEAPCEISKPVLEQASRSSRALNCCRCVSRSPVACPTLDFPGSVKNCHNINYLPQKVFSVLFPGSSSSPAIGAPNNMHDRSLRDIADRIAQALRELANRARAARGTPGDCLLLLGCNQGRHRSPMIRYLLTRWMEESHGMTIDSSDMDNVFWSRHGECTLARQCVHCDVQNQDATREACVAWFRHEMDIAIQHITSATWAAANEISWLGFRDLGLERLPPAPPLPPIPEGLFHRVRDYSPPDPRSRSRGMSGGVSLGRADSRPPPGGRSVTPGPRQKGQGKGESQGYPPNLVNVSRWTRAQHLTSGAAVDVIEVDPAPGVTDRAATVIDVDALRQPVDAGVNGASITYCLNLLRTALLNNEITEEQSRHLSMLSLSTRSQTVGLWDCGTQTTDCGPAHVGTARQSPTNPYTNPVSASRKCWWTKQDVSFSPHCQAVCPPKQEMPLERFQSWHPPPGGRVPDPPLTQRQQQRWQQLLMQQQQARLLELVGPPPPPGGRAVL